METPFVNLPIEELERLHQQAAAELETELLNGASWKAVKAQRALVTRLSIAIHKRKSGGVKILMQPFHGLESQGQGKQ
jgi:hypothetical protein